MHNPKMTDKSYCKIQDLKMKDLKSCHASLRRRMSHPNIYTFFDTSAERHCRLHDRLERLRRGVEIRRPKKRNIQNDADSHVSNVMTTAPTPVFSFCRQSATVWARTPKLFMLPMLTATTKMTPVTSQQSSTHQPLPLPLQPSTQPLCLYV